MRITHSRERMHGDAVPAEDGARHEPKAQLTRGSQKRRARARCLDRRRGRILRARCPVSILHATTKMNPRVRLRTGSGRSSSGARGSFRRSRTATTGVSCRSPAESWSDFTVILAWPAARSWRAGNVPARARPRIVREMDGGGASGTSNVDAIPATAARGDASVVHQEERIIMDGVLRRLSTATIKSE